MAREVKDKKSETGIAREDLRRVVNEAIRQKKQAAEYSGLHGKVVSGAVENYGVEKNAFTIVRRLSEMEEGKRQSVLRSIIDYSHKMGFFDQLDLFDETVVLLETIASEIKSRRHNQSGADGDLVNSLVDGEDA